MQRCIPIIKALQEYNYIPIVASDGILPCYVEIPFATNCLISEQSRRKTAKILNGNCCKMLQNDEPFGMKKKMASWMEQ
jgi:hypothetical protein